MTSSVAHPCAVKSRMNGSAFSQLTGLRLHQRSRGIGRIQTALLHALLHSPENGRRWPFPVSRKTAICLRFSLVGDEGFEPPTSSV